VVPKTPCMLRTLLIRGPCMQGRLQLFAILKRLF